MKKILVIISPGFEEVEAFTVVDILRRAGADVTMAGTVEGIITGRNSIKVLADEHLDKIFQNNFDMIVLPGGLKCTENMKNDGRVKEILKRQNANKKFIAAICAATTVISSIGITDKKKVTSHPSVKEELTGEIYLEERVVIDGHIVTSRSPGTAMEFSFKLIELLYGQTKIDEVNRGVMARL